MALIYRQDIYKVCDWNVAFHIIGIVNDMYKRATNCNNHALRQMNCNMIFAILSSAESSDEFRIEPEEREKIYSKINNLMED